MNKHLSTSDYNLMLLKILIDDNILSYQNELSLFDIDELLKSATKNLCFIRVYHRISQKLGNESEWHNKFKIENERIRQTLTFISRIYNILRSEKIPCVFPKALQHYPDMGHDIDLIVKDSFNKTDNLLRKSLQELNPGNTSILNRLANKTVYDIKTNGNSDEPYFLELEIHHNAMGQFGEFASFTADIFNNNEIILQHLDNDDIIIPVLSCEYTLIMTVMQRLYGHFTIRVSDVARVILILSSPNFNYDKTLYAARKYNVIDGLRFFVTIAVESVAKSGVSLTLHPNITNHLKNFTTTSYYASLRAFNKGYKLSLYKATYFLLVKMLKDITKFRIHTVLKVATLLPLAVFINLIRRLKR